MIPNLYFEDFKRGQRFQTQGATLSEAQILDFAWQHDPQPIHVDKIAAQKGPFGGIIASGFHTLCVAFRLIYQERIINAASMGAPSMDEMRWTSPVRPGDTIRVEGTVLDCRTSQSKPDRGWVTIAYKVKAQDNRTVMTFRTPHMLKKRSAEAQSI